MGIVRQSAHLLSPAAPLLSQLARPFLCPPGLDAISGSLFDQVVFFLFSLLSFFVFHPLRFTGQ